MSKDSAQAAGTAHALGHLQRQPDIVGGAVALRLRIDDGFAAAQLLHDFAIDRRLIFFTPDRRIKQMAFGVDHPHRLDAGAAIDKRLHQSFNIVLT